MIYSTDGKTEYVLKNGRTKLLPKKTPLPITEIQTKETKRKSNKETKPIANEIRKYLKVNYKTLVINKSNKL